MLRIIQTEKKFFSDRTQQNGRFQGRTLPRGTFSDARASECKLLTVSIKFYVRQRGGNEQNRHRS